MDTKLEADYFIEHLQLKLNEEMDHLQELKQSMMKSNTNEMSGNLAMIESGLQNMLDTLQSIRGCSGKHQRLKRIRKVFQKDVRELFKFVGVN